MAAAAPLLGLPIAYSATKEKSALAVFTPAMETKNSSAECGAPASSRWQPLMARLRESMPPP
jgi:hypothetical protein